MNTQTRATSAYSLRVHSTGEQRLTDVATLRAAANRLGLTLTDSHISRGYAAVGYRAPDDTAALSLATALRANLNPGADWALVTGYGIHRRAVPVS